MMKMKNLTKLAYLGAIAFVGIGFTACSSDDDAVANNPSFDGKAVKTQFAINIPRAATPSSRMSDENTQNKNSNFLGMQDIHLLSFAGEPGTSGNTASTSDIKLADINTNGISTSASSKIYSDVNVPVGTSYFLFYAVAPQGTDANSKFSKGVLDATIGASTDAINFKLEQIATSIDNDEKTQLLSVLNAVATVDNWKDQDASTGLGKLYANFVKLKAGSANSIKAALENLYNAVAIWANGTSESTEKTIATDIRTAITTNNYFSATDNSGVYTLMTSLTYPRNINLPDGAVQLTFQNNSFSYDNNSGLTSIPILDPTTLTYPASLYYFISTDIRTSNNTFDNGWPANVTDWASDQTAFWNSFNSTNAKVTATTRAIALKNNIQYGVANLKLSAYCTAQKLSDATTGTQGSTGKTVNVPAVGFKITGVIIGGQPTQVGYNFLPADARSLTQHIYDKDVASTMCARYATNATDATVNYTMVLPNQLGSNEQTVSFAIEFKNNSSVEFQGVDGVVPVNGKFYLVGKLDPNAQSGITNPGGITNPAVFMPDYQTTVTAKISTLKKAYNTIPDLRATNMQLGLSVDLTWTPGLTFDIDLGGDTN